MGGARIAHKITKLTPTTAPMATRPDFIHEVSLEEAKWNKLWQVSRTPTDFSTCEVAMGDRFTPSDIANAAASFEFGTSCLDGLPIKCIGLCSTAMLEALSHLFHIATFFAYYPLALGKMAVKLIDKKDGTFRPIILFRSLFRLHGRLLARITRKWEAVSLATSPFGNNQGRETLDSVFSELDKAGHRTHHRLCHRRSRLAN